ncbi:MAG: PAS domain S-box protein [Ignavibacteriae bacterium]|nr:PAS domain S-box protein [Ignavibacteriota bacterium]
MKQKTKKHAEEKPPYSYLLIDKDFKLISFNDFAFKSIKMLMNVEMCKGMPVLDLIGEEYKVTSAKIFKDVFRGNFIRKEFLFVSPLNNEQYYFEYIYNPIFGEDNKVRYVSISAVDVTENKKTGIALEESEKRYRGIVNLQKSMLVRVDMNGRFVFANEAYCKKFGKSKEELIGNTFMPLVHPDDLKSTLNEMKNLKLPPYRVSVEQRAFTVDGWRWIHWEDVAIKDEKGRIVEIQGVGRDITELKESISSLSETNELLNTILSSSPLGIVVIDLDGKVKFWSDGAARLFSWEASEVVGKFNPIVIKEDYVTYNNKCISLFQGSTIYESNLERNRKDGTVLLLELYGAPLKDSDGNINAGLLIYQDITAKVKVELDNLKLSSALNSSATAIAILNEDLIVESINNRYTQLTEYELKEVKGKSLKDIKPPQMTLNEFDEVMKIISSGKEWRAQMINVTKSGNLYWENILISPVSNVKGVIGNYLLIKEDISENKKAIQELVNSRLRLGTILNNISNIVLYEFGGRNPFISSNVQKILGYSSESILMKENFLESIIVQEDISEYLNEFNKWSSSQSKDTFKINYRCRKANDDIIWVENIMSKVYDGDDYYFCGVIQDITDFKNKENIIAWNETLLRIMTDSTRYGYYVANKKDDSVLYVNEKFCELWNFPEYFDQISRRQIKSSEVLRMCSVNVINPDSFIQSTAKYGNPDNQITFEDEINFLNGRTLRRFSSLLADKGGEYLGRFYLYEDITEKKFFEKIQRFKTDYSVVIEQALDGTILFDAKGAIKGANAIACKLLGYTKHNLIQINIMDLFDTSDPNYEDPRFIDALDGKTIIAKRRLLKADGSVLFVEIHSKMLPNRLIQSVIWEIGKLYYERTSERFDNIINPYVNLLIKLKVFKHGESSITCLNRISLFMKNYHYIFDEGSQLKNTEKEILNRFVSLINEFDNSVYPQLEYIISILNRLNFDFPKTSMYDEVLSAIKELELYSEKLFVNLKSLSKSIKKRDSSENMNQVTENILESIVKIKSRMKVINNSFDDNFTSDIESIFHSLIRSYSDTYPRLRISYKDFTSNPKVVFNKGELVDLLKIFFDNAIEAYADADNSKSPDRIDLVVNQEKENLVLEFIDYGGGIPDSIKTSIFLKGISTKGKNRGFGLSYANTVIQKYGGKFYLDNDLKQGTKFNIILNIL